MANCMSCGMPLPLFGTIGGLCQSCMDRLRAMPSEDEADRTETAASIILTTETSHNLTVTDRLGIVTAECVIGMNVFRDIASSARDLFGGRSETMQRGLRQAREAALTELRLEAYDLGADAVVGVDLDYSEISGGGKSMLFLVASGTAVKLADG